jgi:formylglycine-generating enzyme required for sulfatase activity
MRPMIAARVAIAALAALAAASGCVTSTRQFIVTVATDAPTSWADRLLLEVIDNSGNLACDDCRRLIDVDAHTFPASFGLKPSGLFGGGNPHVRARWYRAAEAGPTGLPEGTNMLDGLGRIPSGVDVPFSDSNKQVLLILWADCFGFPADLTAHTACTIDTVNDRIVRTTAAPEPDLIWTNTPTSDTSPSLDLVAGSANDNPCTHATPDGMVCIHTGAFLLGDTRYVGVETDALPVPVVPVLTGHPWFVDVDEMTVGTVRKLIADFKVLPSDVMRKGDPGVPSTCTYLGVDNPANDAMPINCISQAGALDACDGVDHKVLPPEDVWERAAQGMGSENMYPWGADAPTCDRAVLSIDASCKRKGPLAGGSPNDVTPTGLRNMGGNLAEWASGQLIPYTDPCWQGEPYQDPTCAGMADAPNRAWVKRGGSWARSATSATTFARFASPKGAGDPETGVRCAVDDLLLP